MVYMVFLPFFHMYGGLMLLTAVGRAASIVTLPRFEAELCLAACEKHKVSLNTTQNSQGLCHLLTLYKVTSPFLRRKIGDGTK